MQIGGPEIGSELSELHRTYDKIRGSRRRSGCVSSLRDVMLSPQVLAELRATTYQPLTPGQIEINKRGFAEVEAMRAKLAQGR